MSETKQLLANKRAITPLWIVALFVSLTETVLGIAVTQTTGGIQIALTTFVITFPLLIAGSFFAILWRKPYVFYPPTEFGHQTSVLEYVEAMQRQPAFVKQYDVTPESQPLTEDEKRATSEITDLFIKKTSVSGLIIFYSFAKAYSKKVSFDLNELCEISELDYSHAVGFLVAASSAGLMFYNRSDSTVTIVEMNRVLIDKTFDELKGLVLSGGAKNRIDTQIKTIDKFFGKAE